jgi:hypothetical protein
MDKLMGKCVVPKPTSGWPDDPNGPAALAGIVSPPSGVHVWLANLLHSEQMAWPFSVFLSSSSLVGPLSPTDANRTYTFQIPLFSHIEFPTSHLYGGSPRTTVHSWSSNGAGLWTVFCNGWAIDARTGEMRVGEYTALDGMDEGGDTTALLHNWVDASTRRSAALPLTNVYPNGTSGWELTVDYAVPSWAAGSSGSRTYYMLGSVAPASLATSSSSASSFPLGGYYLDGGVAPTGAAASNLVLPRSGTVRKATCLNNTCKNDWMPNGLWGTQVEIPPTKNRDTVSLEVACEMIAGGNVFLACVFMSARLA